MKKTSILTKTTSVAAVLAMLGACAILVFAASAYAATQDPRDRGSTGRTIDLTPTPTPPVPAPSPAPTPPPPPPPSGGITSVTTGEVNTGGNTGGTVTTGDEHVEVHEVNIGPTNNTSNTS